MDEREPRARQGLRLLSELGKKDLLEDVEESGCDQEARVTLKKIIETGGRAVVLRSNGDMDTCVVNEFYGDDCITVKFLDEGVIKQKTVPIKDFLSWQNRA